MAQAHLVLLRCGEAFALGSFVATLSHAALNARFEREFDTAFDALGDKVKVVGSAARVGATLSLPQSRKLALSLLSGVVERDSAPKVVDMTLRVGKPMLALGKQTSRWLNPVDGMAPGLSWLTARLADGGRLLLRRLRKISALEKMAAEIERSIARQRLFYRDRGFWHARPDAVTVQNGRRQLHAGGKTYLVIDMDGQGDVLALQQGADLRLANPESGLTYGPVLNGEAQPLPVPVAVAVPVLVAAPAPAHYAWRLCRVKRAETEDQGCDQIRRAPQFGRGIYSFADDFRFPGVQARVKQPGMPLALLPVNLNNIGFASYTRRPGATKPELVYNNRYFFFNEQVWIAHKGRLQPASIRGPFPERIVATVLYSARADNAGNNAPQLEDPDYLMFDIALPPIGDDPERYFNRFIVPFGNYPGRHGTRMGMIEIPGTSYKFYAGYNWSVRLPAGQEIVLKKATELDYRMFEQYQQINVGVRTTPDMFRPESLRQLRQMGELTQQRFDIVLKRAEQLILDAGRALKSRGPHVEKVLQAFMPAEWPADRKQSFIAALAKNIHTLRGALPMLKRNKLDIIGFGNAYRAGSEGGSMGHGEQYALAEALAGSMEVDMDLIHTKQAVITFDELHFAGPVEPVASGLVHELSHAIYRSRDTISQASTELVYPGASRFDRRLIDITPLVAAAAQAGSDSAHHASTFEHLVVTLAYTQRDDTLVLLHSIFNGGARYSYRADPAVPECADACALSR